MNLPPFEGAHQTQQQFAELRHAALQLWQRLLNIDFKLNHLTRLSINLEQKTHLWMLLAQLESLPVSGRFYWSDRNHSGESLACGIAHDIRYGSQSLLPQAWQQMQTNLQNQEARYFGGLSFDGQSGVAEWQGFDALRFTLPLMEIRHDGNGSSLSVQLLASSPVDWYRQFAEIREILSFLSRSQAQPLAELPSLESKVFNTDAARWQSQVEEVLDLIQDKALEKVVLARATSHLFGQNVSLASIASHWQKKSKNSFGFLFDFGQASFIGFSPERLLRQQGREVATEALAGTQARGRNEVEDLALESVLRHDQKLIHEHRLVSDFIEKQLQLHGQRILFDAEVGILKLSHVQHRQAAFRAQLKHESALPNLLLALFPTPAVCGLPQQAAKQTIHRIESSQRGWYAGTVGVVGDHQCEFSVSIRSGLLNKNELISYAGAGIVAGSQPKVEWRELNDKSKIVEEMLRTREPS